MKSLYAFGFALLACYVGWVFSDEKAAPVAHTATPDEQFVTGSRLFLDHVGKGNFNPNPDEALQVGLFMGYVTGVLELGNGEYFDVAGVLVGDACTTVATFMRNNPDAIKQGKFAVTVTCLVAKYPIKTDEGTAFDKKTLRQKGTFI